MRPRELSSWFYLQAGLKRYLQWRCLFENGVTTVQLKRFTKKHTATRYALKNLYEFILENILEHSKNTKFFLILL